MIKAKELPILFSAPMVRAILEGRKTVTRRAIKHNPFKCPCGKPGDRLWVREAWEADVQVDAVPPRDLSQGEPIRYPADGAVRQAGCAMITPGKLRPSIHMPRWVSRILLEVTDVRMERLQDITPEQCIAEGIDAAMCRQYLETAPSRHTLKEAEIHGFSGLWNSAGGNWDANPWVWCVSFQRIA
jgi:hypothetical protein